MTKREICERLLKIRDYVKETDTWPYNPGQRNLTLHNVGAVIAKDLDELLLDIAAPEDDKHDLISLWRRTGRLEPSSSEEQKSKEVHEAAEAFKRLHRAGIVDENGELFEWYRDDNADQGTNA